MSRFTQPGPARPALRCARGCRLSGGGGDGGSCARLRTMLEAAERLEELTAGLRVYLATAESYTSPLDAVAEFLHGLRQVHKKYTRNYLKLSGRASCFSRPPAALLPRACGRARGRCVPAPQRDPRARAFGVKRLPSRGRRGGT